MAIFPRTLVVRTNVFGWSPLPQAPGLVERLLSQGEDDTALPLDCVRHATPILATDLVEILEQAYGRRLQGVYHIGGAERVNPARFGALLAAQFNCRYTLPAQAAALAERRMEFGGGETSLQGRKIRNELDLALPLLREGLGRLYAQSLNGFRDRFEQSSAAVQDMVA
jgi:dTDP-4-dehydrorhamnose reductase